MDGHAYPTHLADFVRARCRELDGAERMLMEPGALEQLLSTAYQASLLKEEERAVTFRLIVGAPEEFPEQAGPPNGLHRLVFDEPRPMTEHELRRLCPAAKYHRALIGVRPDARHGFVIWGILQSGPRWMQSAVGGRTRPAVTDPAAFVVRVSAPGRLAVSRGGVTLGELRGGRLALRQLDIFEARWLREKFARVRGELLALHEEARTRAGIETPDEPWATLDPEVIPIIAQQMLKRLIVTIRSAHHGGTILILPPEAADDALERDRYVHVKYKFRDDAPRRRYRTLILSIMNALAAHEGDGSGEKVGWNAYQASTCEQIVALDEGIFEMSHLIAALADVDGAVVLTQRFELLGFGAEIAGDLAEVRTVERALDLEGTHREPETVEGVGTRHRSAYRLCQRLHDALAIVVSQDGGVRVMAWTNGAVAYWDHVSAEGME